MRKGNHKIWYECKLENTTKLLESTVFSKAEYIREDEKFFGRYLDAYLMIEELLSREGDSNE